MIYHLVTEEELGIIMLYLEDETDDALRFQVFDIFKRIESRPDPLALLDKWISSMAISLDYAYYDPTVYVSELQEIIKQLRENPEAVAEMGRKEGWYL